MAKTPGVAAETNATETAAATETAKPRGTQMLTKLVLKNVGDPKKARANMPDNVNQVVLGTVYGIATSVKHGKMPDQLSTYTCLKGNFEGIPADASRDIIRAGILFLPESFQAPIEEMLEGVGDGNGGWEKEPVASVMLAYEVSVIRATNAQEYSWAVKPLTAPAESDPLMILRQNIPAVAAQLAAPAAQAQIAAPKVAETA